MLWANSLGAKSVCPGCSMQFCWLTHAASAVYKHQKHIAYTHFHCSERDSCMGNFCSIAAGIELHPPLACPAVSILYVCVNIFSSPSIFLLIHCSFFITREIQLFIFLFWFQERRDDLQVIVGAIGKNPQMPKITPVMMNEIEKVCHFSYCTGNPHAFSLYIFKILNFRLKTIWLLMPIWLSFH